MRIFTNPNYNFIKWRWHAIALSAAIILGGLGVIVTRGMALGIDFSGGTLVILEFERQVGEQQVRDAVSSVSGDKVVQQYGPAADRKIMIRLPQTNAPEQGASLEQASQQIEQALQKAGLPHQVVSRDLVGPVIGADLTRRGILATLVSILAITAYIALRFRPSFAVGAIAATFHDIFVTLAFLAFFKYDMTLNVVAAILTITGYSVNDTIVIFDRVRENMRSKRREPLEHIVNEAVNQTLGRTIITAGTTFLSVLALFLFGGEVLRGFAFTMLVGVVSGTYSTIFIASSIAILLSKKPQTAAAPAEAKSAARKQKGAKAS